VFLPILDIFSFNEGEGYCYIVLSWLGLARFGSAQQRFDQIGQAKPNQTVACGLSHGSLAFLDVDISLFWMAEQPELNQGV
jgi:hypothetical protein